MKRTLVLLVVAVLTAASLTISGCTPAPTSDEGETSAPQADTAVEEEEEETSAPQAEVIEWRMPSAYTPQHVNWYTTTGLSERIGPMTNGRLKITVYPDGELMGAFDIFDAVSDGTVQCGAETPVYWGGKNTAFGIVGTLPIYFSMGDHMQWYFEGGGRQLVDKLYAKFNIKWLPLFFTGCEAGLQTNVPVTSTDDVKGMKLRIGPQLGQYVFQELGAESVSLGMADIYEAMQRGVIDGFEGGMVGSNYDQGLCEVAAYLCAPAWWQPSSVGGVAINMDAWNSLPPDLQACFEDAMLAQCVESANYINNSEIEGLRKTIDYGTTITKMDDPSMVKVTGIVNGFMEDESAKNPDYAEMLKSMMDFLKSWEDVRDFQSPWGFGQNPVGYPNIP
jgi:TRAP-type mannitol/chloroaromatic compound transport system substrate-binding protein